MAKLRGIELTEGIVELFKQSVLSASDSFVIKIAKVSDKHILQGLRPTPQSAPQIKKRLAAQLDRQSPINDNLLLILAAYRPLSFFEDFAIPFITDHLDPLCAVYGHDAVLASLLLDERAEIKQLAEDILSGLREIGTLSKKAILRFVDDAIESFEPFWAPLIPPEHEEDAPKISSDAINTTGDKIRTLEEELDTAIRQNKKLAAERKEYKKRAAQCDSTLRALTKSEESAERLRLQVTELKIALCDSKAQYKELNSVLTDAVRDEVHSSIHTWIKRPEELEKVSKALGTLHGKDVVTRAEHIISRQQQVDKHAGNRRVLLDRLEELENLRNQIADLTIESLNPLKELNEIHQELKREISSIQQRLELPYTDSAFLRNTLSKLGSATSPDELACYKRLLNHISELDLLSPEKVRPLFAYCDERMSLLYEKHLPSLHAPQAIIDPAYRLKRALADHSNMLWLLDGHNVLFSLPDLFGSLDAAGNHTDSSRLALSDFLVQITRNIPECQVRLFYDGPQYSEISASPNVKVFYSGGEGDNRADEAICSMLDYKCWKGNDTPVLLTTDDRGLSQQAENRGASIMSINEFFAVVDHFNRHRFNQLPKL